MKRGDIKLHVKCLHPLPSEMFFEDFFQFVYVSAENDALETK